MTNDKIWLPDAIVYLVLLNGGIVLLFINVRQLMIYEPRLRQPTTIGTIGTSQFHDAPKRDDAYVPRIEFTYWVDNVLYQKNAVEDINRVIFFNVADVETLLANYPIGMEVSVHYEEGKPETAVFQSGIGTPFNDSRRRLIYIFWNVLFIILVIYAAIKRSDYDYDHRIQTYADPLKRLFDIPKP